MKKKNIAFNITLDVRQLIEDHFCHPALSTIPSSKTRPACHHSNESTDRCQEWNRCLSLTRLNDGSKNCLNGRDEVQQTAMEIEKSCAQVRRHRFRCSSEQATCLNVAKLGDETSDCRNGFDEQWFGTDRRVSQMNWHESSSLLRQYIDQSWRSLKNSDMHVRSKISFRSHCDTLNHLSSNADENLVACQEDWICSDGSTSL